MFWFLFLGSVNGGELACRSPAKGLCQLGRVEFKTRTFKHLANEAFNVIEPIVTKEFSDTHKGFTAHFNEDEDCRSPQKFSAMSEAQRKKKNCLQIPVITPDNKGTVSIDDFQGGEDSSFSFNDIKIKQYKSKFVQLRCSSPIKNGKHRCKMIANLDLTLKGDMNFRNGGKNYAFGDNSMGFDNVNIHLLGEYDPQKNEFTLLKIPQGDNGFDFSQSKLSVGYLPEDSEKSGIAIDYLSKFYDQLENEYENGESLRKKRSAVLQSAKESYKFQAQRVEKMVAETLSERRPIFGKMTPVSIREKFESSAQSTSQVNQNKVSFLCSKSSGILELTCNKYLRSRRFHQERETFLQTRDKRVSLEDLDKMSEGAKWYYICDYLKKSNPTACSYGRPRREGLLGTFRAVFNTTEAEKEYDQVISQLRSWVGASLHPEEYVSSQGVISQSELREYEADLVNTFDRLAYKQITLDDSVYESSSQSFVSRSETINFDESAKKEVLEQFSPETKNRLFGDLYYKAQFGAEDEEGWRSGFRKFKRAIDAELGANFFSSDRLSSLEKAQRLEPHLANLKEAGTIASEVNQIHIGVRNEVLAKKGACQDQGTCNVLTLAEKVVPRVIENSPEIQSEIGEAITDSVLNEIIEEFNTNYRHLSPFGEGQNYPVPVPCVQCLVDHSILEGETDSYLESLPHQGSYLKKLNVPSGDSKTAFKAWMKQQDVKFTEWLSTLTGKGVSSNPCIEKKPTKSAVAEFDSYFGSGPRAQMDRVRERVEQVINSIDNQIKFGNPTRDQKLNLENYKKQLELQTKSILSKQKDSLDIQSKLQTAISIQSTLDMLSSANNPGDAVSALNLYSDLSCGASESCVESDVEKSRQSSGKNDASIFLNVEAVNNYLKKLHDMGLLNICINSNGRTCARSLTVNNMCSESGENGKRPVNYHFTSQAPQITLDPVKKEVSLRGEVVSSLNPVSGLDPEVDIYSKANLVRCPKNASRQCIQNVETVAKIWNWLPKNIDKEMEEALLEMGVSGELANRAENQGFGFDGMDLTDIVVHKCSIEIRANFIKNKHK